VSTYHAALVWLLRVVAAITLFWAVFNAWALTAESEFGADAGVTLYSALSSALGAFGALTLSELLTANASSGRRRVLIWLLRGAAVLMAALSFPTLAQILSQQLQTFDLAQLAFAIPSLMLPPALLLGFAEVLVRARHQSSPSIGHPA
jgi:FtsH-binding integral membrane protein